MTIAVVVPFFCDQNGAASPVLQGGEDVKKEVLYE